MTMAHRGFAFLSMTKTGSTAVEAAFYEHAQITARRPSRLKHMTAGSFHRSVVPILDQYGHPRESYEVVAVVREPVDWVLSWYRYRSRVGARQNPGYTGEITFEAFTDLLVSGELDLGQATRFVGGRGSTLVDRLFRYDDLDDAVHWMAERLDVPVPALDRINVSPHREVPVTAATRSRLEEHYADDVALYQAARGRHS